MKQTPKITKVEVRQFKYPLKNVGREPTSSVPIYEPGAVLDFKTYILRIFTDVGLVGEYMGGHLTQYAAIPTFIHAVLGRNPLHREAIYNDTKAVLQQSARMAMSQIDIALWDLAGKFYNAPVYELLGGYRTNIPCYASTYLADRQPGGLDSPEAHAEFAQQCLELGYRGFKTHLWQNAPVEDYIATNHVIAERVGGKMDLMCDAHCGLKTFGDALKLGWSCDQEKFFWWEDPFMDGGVSAFAHRKLRQLVKTPLLQMEHVRGLEQHVDFIVANASDFVRGDLNWDGGITGVMKIAHAAEGFGLDIELHLIGPAVRHVIAAIRNTNYYEMGLVHPKAPLYMLPNVYKCDYTDELGAIDKNGCVPVPQGPGLGVEYDWDYINKNTTWEAVYE